MEKEKLINILTSSVNNLYNCKDPCLEDLDIIEKNLKEILEHLSQDRIYREILLLIQTIKLAQDDKKEHLKIALIVDLEKEIKRLKLSN